MGQPLPGPVVTIVDPHHPGLVRALPPDPVVRRRPWRARERGLAAAVAVLLVAGLSTSARLRKERALLDIQVTGSAVDAQVLGDVVELVVLAGTTRDVTLTDGSGGGWSLAGPDRLRRRDLTGVSLTRRLTCDRPLEPPDVLDAAAAEGDVTGRVQLRVRTVWPLVRQALRAACGDLDADEALVLDGSSIARGPRETTVGLRLSNTGRTPVRVVRVRYPGFALADGATLPVTLAARGARGALSFAELRVLLRDCGAARAALDTSRQSTQVDLLEADVDGRGGRGTTRLDVRGVLVYLEQAWEEACG